MLNDREKGTMYVLYEIQQAWVAMSRITFGKFHLRSGQQTLTLLEANSLQRPAEQLSQIASESIVLLKDRMQSIVSEVFSAIISGVNTDGLDVEPLLQLVCN